MRTAFILSILFITASLKAQFYTPASFNAYSQHPAFYNHNYLKDSGANKKWFLSSYGGISTSFVFFKGGNATVVSAPLNLQLNRRLNNNLYAFAGVTAAPAYINFNNTFLHTDVNKGNPNNNFFKSNNFGAYSRVDIGLTYVNDAKTFSISGSFGIEKSSYPMFPYNQSNVVNQPSLPYSANRHK